jgi:hypothetical protein
MNGKVKALLAAAQDAEERHRWYSRVADILDKLTLVLSVPAFILITAGLVLYLMYDWWQIFATGAALWFAGYATRVMHDIYSNKAAKAARQACVFRRTAETIIEIHKLKAKLEKEMDELTQKLKKRGDEETSAD